MLKSVSNADNKEDSLHCKNLLQRDHSFRTSQNLKKNYYFLPLDTQTYVRISGRNKR